MASELSAEQIRELMHYDPKTGICLWKIRDSKWFEGNSRDAEWCCNAWNKRYAGTKIGRLSKGYIEARILGKMYGMHRVIWLYMTGKWPLLVDHINGNPSDNRWKNLRETDQATNNKNLRQRSDNKSGATGVYFQKSTGKWQSKIKSSGVDYHLGAYQKREDAILARKVAEKCLGFHANHGRK
ncbi:HNH endonuclease [Brucella anthropi]|uniref:HNH endonuclease n=1 Tax=Brucella anthropi (strain ATCC 49188 / DSM 6882 / CCUG 24695 / JCM 21032 / LMG 3331 / NBRC 15819 / NCTC 12168 / Alc 37) TaxID=439375 RepID=A6WVD5_BRUA4|nr:HNH endonuclease signature motif containing protein [Brucella anthropi]ABS12939.1 HNH endonuclease [Brucella anthropi ATCC 49188]QQC24810.1 HNH endonuclease [Brucella anthropi]SUA60172.1 Uncharacterised protein [Brucella anthropi]HBQ33117.1 HNH endonuclease [Brucella anthropi]